MLELLRNTFARLNRAQSGLIFMIVATVLGLGLVATLTLLATKSSVAWIPDSYRDNVVNGTVLAGIATLAIVWAGRTVWAGGILLISIAVSSIFAAAGAEFWARSILGVGLLIVLFMLLLQAARWLLSAPISSLSIARLVLDEAIRMKLALIFIVGLIILIPMLTAQIDPAERLQYRLQTFLSYGTGLSYALLAVMTLFVSTATVALEQRNKTIFQIVSKPVSRFSYLFGKWLGVVTLNAILLILTGSSVFWFTQYLGQLPAVDEFDSLAVSEQVLTARVGVTPTVPDFRAEAKQRAEEELASRPELQNDDAAMAMEVARRGNEILSELQAEMLSIAPGDFREYKFENVHPVRRTKSATANLDNEPIVIMDRIKSLADLRLTNSDGSVMYAPGSQYRVETFEDRTHVYLAPERVQQQQPQPIAAGQTVRVEYFPESALTFRFKIHSGENMPDVVVPITIWLPGNIIMPQKAVLVQTQSVLIPAGFVSDDGTLTLRVVNGDMNTEEAIDKTITFPYDGLEIMYKVGSFEWNFFRAMTITWMKLSFLAMLGVAAGTFASFPVACLLAFAIFLGAETAPFLGESLENYEVVDKVTNEIHIVRALVYAVATPVNFALQAYGEMRPTQNLIEGRLVSWKAVAQTFGVIIVGWTGLTGLIGWIVFRRRQLAIYSGHQ